ncbi:hypothetical protein CRI94_09335 [Longibacter salinarum]|uniref:FecR protein domain-containing protein n=1 Tax=Longibacter salinarum TaxID=1850348 RepID=A0A2A8CYP0_9BACT|nr:FecR domain-containing protein [Longibacter salinarum]PEN13508.1 hypothetical protein CRI94_09335 [Longibacter salinarum]
MSAPSESDRFLARRLGVLLDDDRMRLRDLDVTDLEVASSQDAPFAQALLQYRRETLDARPSPRPEQTERIWAGIEREMEEPSRASSPDAPREDRAPRRSRSTVPGRVQWAAFALLVVGAIGVTWFVLQPDPLREILVAQSGEQVQTLTTADGSTIRLRPNSTLHRVEVTGADRYRLEGEAQFSVPSRSTIPFEVQAGEARVTVLGTEFTVRTWTREPQVYLSEGTVAVSHVPSSRADTLRPGQQAAISGRSITVEEADPASFVGWIEQRLSFTRRSAESVARELEQQYAVDIVLPQSIRAETISGELILEGREQTLADFAAVLGGSFDRGQDETYQFSSDASRP